MEGTDDTEEVFPGVKVAPTSQSARFCASKMVTLPNKSAVMGFFKAPWERHT
jgi:hypothetical protein